LLALFSNTWGAKLIIITAI